MPRTLWAKSVCLPLMQWQNFHTFYEDFAIRFALVLGAVLSNLLGILILNRYYLVRTNKYA